MSSFINIRSSRLDVPCKKVFLKFLQDSLKNIKNIRDAVFNLNFQVKRTTTLLKGDSGIYAFMRISLTFPWRISLRISLRTPILQNTNRLLLLRHSSTWQIFSTISTRKRWGIFEIRKHNMVSNSHYLNV